MADPSRGTWLVTVPLSMLDGSGSIRFVAQEDFADKSASSLGRAAMDKTIQFSHA